MYDTEIQLEPLTVFIGANGSGKSNICEALFVLSNFLQKCLNNRNNGVNINNLLESAIKEINRQQSNASIQTKLWHQELEYLLFRVNSENLQANKLAILAIKFDFNKQEFLIRALEDLEDKVLGNFDYSVFSSSANLTKDLQAVPTITKSLEEVKIYDFSPIDLSLNYSIPNMDKTGKGITYALVNILHTNRQQFDELEERFTQLIPNIKRISLPLGEIQSFKLELIDKYSNQPIPTHDISDGTLRILAFLTALYEKETPSIICFEEP